LEEEGQLSEQFTILGWIINTRTLTLALPKKKFSRWTKDLQDIISKKKVSYATLESSIGRLNHAASAWPKSKLDFFPMTYLFVLVRRMIIKVLRGGTKYLLNSTNQSVKGVTA
jgi:hypothetical protein